MLVLPTKIGTNAFNSWMPIKATNFGLYVLYVVSMEYWLICRPILGGHIGQVSVDYQPIIDRALTDRLDVCWSMLGQYIW